MNQPLLPLPCFGIPERHMSWLIAANSGDYHDKKMWFYPLKNKILLKHGCPDGWDLQIIERRCWCGDGIWRGVDGDVPERYWQVCWKCGGSSVYRTDEVVLLRIILNGRVFHIPRDIARPSSDPVNMIRGIIHHDVPLFSIKGEAALSRLLWHYDRPMFWRYQKKRFKESLRRIYWNCRAFYEKWCIIGDYHDFVDHEDGDLPF